LSIEEHWVQGVKVVEEVKVVKFWPFLRNSWFAPKRINEDFREISFRIWSFFGGTRLYAFPPPRELLKKFFKNWSLTPSSGLFYPQDIARGF